ncbi:MAG: hypothetical protein WCI04_01185 [archaeon]
MPEISEKERNAMNMLIRFQKTAFLNGDLDKQLKINPDIAKLKNVKCILPLIETKGKIKSLFYQPVLFQNGDWKFIKVKRPEGMPYVDKSKSKLKVDGKVVGIRAQTIYYFTDAKKVERKIAVDKNRLCADKYYLLELFAKEIIPHVDEVLFGGYLGAFIEMYKELKPNEDLPRYATRTSFSKALKRVTATK